jgi:hypothetical protein
MHLRKLLGARLAPAFAIMLGVALSLPSLNMGLQADDWIQKLIATGPQLLGLERRPLDYFTFADGIAAHMQALVDQGMFPWWSDVTVKLSFFRPLTALTHWLDWTLFPSQLWLMHAHSLVWLGLALVAAAFAYRRLLQPSWLATLASALYGVDHVHGPAIGWIANRSALVTVALGLPALALHDRHRRQGWRPGAWLAPLSLLAGLCAGEAALSVALFLFAYALTLEAGPLAQRLVRLWPYALVVVAWRLVYHHLGHGASGSGVYLDPAADCADFLRTLPGHAAALLTAQFAFPPSELGIVWPVISPLLEPIMKVYALAMVALMAWVLWPTMQRHAVARFFGLSVLLATLPVCATLPSDRLLCFVGFPAMGLVARFLADEQHDWRRWFAGGFVVLHLILSPPLLALRVRSMAIVEVMLGRANATIPATAGITHKTVVLMNPPSDVFTNYVQFTRAATGEPRPQWLRWLATGANGVELVREDATTLRVRRPGGFLQNRSERMFRSPHAPLVAGQHITLPGMRVDILGPDEARMHFAVPLEDASLVWMRWQGDRGYVPATPPAIGTTLALPPIDLRAAGAAKR